jgi:hypothetical protein
MDGLGKYCGLLSVAFQRAGGLMCMLAVGWLLYPVALKMVVYPNHLIGFEYWIQRQLVPSSFTSEMHSAGEIEAIGGLVILSLLLLGLVVLFYRKAQFSIALWPLAAVLIGVLGNGAWWVGTQEFDLMGAIVGLMPLAIMVVCEAVCEQLGQDFVFGPGNRPAYNPWKRYV